jgi:hypothetical protein
VGDTVTDTMVVAMLAMVTALEVTGLPSSSSSLGVAVQVTASSRSNQVEESVAVLTPGSTPRPPRRRRR